MTTRRRAEALRLETPRLEPEDAFVERLADAARTSRPSVVGRRQRQGLRVGLATAGVVGLTVGGAWAAGNLVEREDQAPGRPPPSENHPPISPTAEAPGERTAPPSPGAGRDRSDEGRGERGRPGAPGRPEHPGQHGRDRAEERRNDHGRPDERGRPDRPGQPGQHGRDRAEDRRGDHGRPDDPGPGRGPKGTGGGRRADSPR